MGFEVGEGAFVVGANQAARSEEQLGPFGGESEAFATWRKRSVESEDDALAQCRVERL